MHQHRQLCGVQPEPRLGAKEQRWDDAEAEIHYGLALFPFRCLFRFGGMKLDDLGAGLLINICDGHRVPFTCGLLGFPLTRK
jgi:hypothetical protein